MSINYSWFNLLNNSIVMISNSIIKKINNCEFIEKITNKDESLEMFYLRIFKCFPL